VDDGAPRQQVVLLEDESAVGPWAGDDLPVHLHAPAAWREQSIHDAKERGLAAAAGANDPNERAPLPAQVHVPQARDSSTARRPEYAAKGVEPQGGDAGSGGANRRRCRGAAAVAHSRTSRQGASRASQARRPMLLIMPSSASNTTYPSSRA